MHFKLIIIMPPTGDVHAAVNRIMDPWNELARDPELGASWGAFWDWWEIGGLWSDAKVPDVRPVLVAQSSQCHRVIIAAPGFDHRVNAYIGPLEAIFMLQKDFFNGLSLQDAVWDGTIGHALKLWSERLLHSTDERRRRLTPAKDWLAVTVDYHS